MLTLPLFGGMMTKILGGAAMLRYAIRAMNSWSVIGLSQSADRPALPYTFWAAA